MYMRKVHIYSIILIGLAYHTPAKSQNTATWRKVAVSFFFKAQLYQNPQSPVYQAGIKNWWPVCALINLYSISIDPTYHTPAREPEHRHLKSFFSKPASLKPQPPFYQVGILPTKN